MSDAVQIALIVAVGSAVPGVCSLIIQLVQHGTIKKLELNTNSIKDALVEETRKSSLARGAEIERIRAAKEKSDFEAGKASDKNL